MIEIKNIGKEYDRKKVLKDINFSISNHEFLVILGPSGSGKSTFLRLISGIEEMTSGKIIIDGKEKTRQELIKDTATIFQSFGLFPNMSVYNNICFPIRKENKVIKNKKANEIAKILKIDHLLKRNVTKLSGGEAQRVSIARALVRDTSIYLFDEPLSSLDENLKKDLISEIKFIYNSSDKLFIYVTHNQEEAKLLSTKVLVLNNGKIEGFGTYEELYNNPPNLFVAEFLGTLNKIKSKVILQNNLYYLNIYNKLYLLKEERYNYDRLKHYKDNEVIIGLRPEYIKIDEQGMEVEVEKIVNYPLYNRYYIKDNLIVESNTKKNCNKIHLLFNEIMIYDKETLERI